jgi:radical SAM protein with 4Fe4S-binding SPASM domain
VQISIDGGSETHDALRGAGTHAAARRALRILKKHRIATMASFTVSRMNANEFPEVVRAAEEDGVDVVWSDRLLPLGRGAGMRDSILSAEEVDRFFETMFRSSARLRRHPFCRTRVRMHRALQFRTLAGHGAADVTPYRCNAGRGLLALMPDGTILPCRRMPVAVGHLGSDSLEEVYREAHFLRSLRVEERVAAGCEECTWRTSCGGGLRCLAYACTGDPFRADPQCSLARKPVGCAGSLTEVVCNA